MRILSKILIVTSVVTAITATIAFGPAAIAQGTNGIQLVSFVKKQCPTGYLKAQQRDANGNLVAADPQLCYPDGDNPPAVYQKISGGGLCVEGYYEDTQDDWCTDRAPQKVNPKNPKIRSD